MSAKPLRTRSKSASAERCLRPLGATIDMATPDPKTSNGFSVQGIFAWGFTKRQPGGRGGYRVLSLSGNCCFVLAMTTLSLVSVGTSVVQQGKRRLVDPHWFRGSSYLKIGWKWIGYALSRCYELITSLSLSGEPVPDPSMASTKTAHNLP